MVKLSSEKKAEMERVQQYEDRLDNVLFKCMEIMKMPEKWALNGQGELINVYPHPIVKREAKRVEAIEYLPHKSYKLPEVLIERAIYWDNVLSNAEAKAKTNTLLKRGIKHPTTSKHTGRPAKHTQKDVDTWIELKNKGLSYAEISRRTGVNAYTISYHVKRVTAS